MKATLIDLVVKRTELEFKQKDSIKKWREAQSESKSLGQKISELNKNIGVFALEKSNPTAAEDYEKLHASKKK